MQEEELKCVSHLLCFSLLGFGAEVLLPWTTLIHSIQTLLSFGNAKRTSVGEGNGTPLQYSCLEIPRTEEPGGLQSVGLLQVWHNWATSLSLFTFSVGEGNDNPLQCSCLENPRDSGAWWAAVYGVAQSRTRLKRLSSSSKGPQCLDSNIHSYTLWAMYCYRTEKLC